MDNSSDDSFTWSDVPNDSSFFDDIIPSMVHDQDVTDGYTSGGEYKKKLHNQLFIKQNDSKKPKKRKIQVEDQESSLDELPATKKVKIEKESDHETSKKKKKKKKHKSDSEHAGIDLLDALIKTEPSLLSPKKLKKTESKCETSDAEANIIKNGEQGPTEGHSSEVNNTESDINSTCKKKKKKQRHKKSEDSYEYAILKEEFIAEETIVQSPPKEKKKKRDKKKSRDLESDSAIDSTSIEKQPVELDISNTTFVNNLSLNNPDVISSTLINNTVRETINEENDQEEAIDREQSNLNLSIRNSRTSKISDRIRFEDDLDVNKSSEEDSSTIGHKLKQYISSQGLQETSLHLQPDQCLTDDDDIWVIECPSHVDKNNIKGITLNIDTKSKFKVDGQSYVGKLEERSTNLTIVTRINGKYMLKNRPNLDVIKFKKKIPKTVILQENYSVVNQPSFIPLPETKVRHPLFGSNYKEAIKIPVAVAEKLKNIVDDMIVEQVPIKKEKKKKKKHGEVGSIEQIKLDDEKVPIIKKERKRKRTSLVPEDILTPEVEAPPLSKKKKHSKQELTADAWESEQAIEENLFNF